MDKRDPASPTRASTKRMMMNNHDDDNHHHDHNRTNGNNNDNDRIIEEIIMDLCIRRGPNKTICPSEAARAVFAGRRTTAAGAPAGGLVGGGGGGNDDDGWRAYMNDVRRVGIDLVRQGRIVVTQRGQIINDPTSTRGPIRFRLSQSS